VSAYLDRNYGAVNALLGLNTDWYRVVGFWPPFLVFLNAWKGVGYQSVLYLAVLSGISKEYYEAAVLDGAGRLKQARYIALPHLRFIASISLINAMAGILKGDFGLLYTITRNTGALYPVTNILDTYIFNGLQSSRNLGMTTAAGFYQSAVGLVLVLAVNQIVKKIDADTALF
jgi:putative aldouronate transport system permease protein